MFNNNGPEKKWGDRTVRKMAKQEDKTERFKKKIAFSFKIIPSPYQIFSNE